MLSAVVVLNPDYVQAYNNLGTVFADLEQFDDAIAAYNQALEIDPNFQAAQDNLALIEAAIAAEESTPTE
ncbi:tetratricopeptide repeat protein [Leptolyngbya cf. ectocarpi LEGE 11479]|uniref:Tetratricopeptide repeat protein n=1 Tax=Leptolyngbya cf. ectocarpi LEGE 11479 TaxID=1828722 RepID=A0A928ZZX9_LEPEC|nr:tetratricopeptide repeat protein [Leptolyngbya ectocarpi]MBE9070481.1 tetratricopeptide repeat protein [Leptolyngbya cf. ectocarpi LEGE 11479]